LVLQNQTQIRSTTIQKRTLRLFDIYAATNLVFRTSRASGRSFSMPPALSLRRQLVLHAPKEWDWLSFVAIEDTVQLGREVYLDGVRCRSAWLWWILRFFASPSCGEPSSSPNEIDYVKPLLGKGFTFKWCVTFLAFLFHDLLLNIDCIAEASRKYPVPPRHRKRMLRITSRWPSDHLSFRRWRQRRTALALRLRLSLAAFDAACTSTDTRRRPFSVESAVSWYRLSIAKAISSVINAGRDNRTVFENEDGGMLMRHWQNAAYWGCSCRPRCRPLYTAVAMPPRRRMPAAKQPVAQQPAIPVPEQSSHLDPNPDAPAPGGRGIESVHPAQSLEARTLILSSSLLPRLLRDSVRYWGLQSLSNCGHQSFLETSATAKACLLP